MKKTIIIALALLAVLVLSVVVFADFETYTLTYKTETTMPLDYPTIPPEEYMEYQFGLLEIDFGTSLGMTFNNYVDDEMTNADTPKIPVPYYIDNYDLVEFKGWDNDPNSFDFDNNSQDVTFTAKFEIAENAVPIYIKGIRRGTMRPCIRVTDDRCSSATVIMFVPKNHVLTEEDIPMMAASPLLTGSFALEIDRFSQQFVGVEVVQPMEVDIHVNVFYDVVFRNSLTNEETEPQRVGSGDAAVPPSDESMQVEGYAFAGWDYDYTNIGNAKGSGEKDNVIGDERLKIVISSIHYMLGDIDQNNVVNTGDVVCLLKYLVGMNKYDEKKMLLIADYAKDGVINTGDAVFLLRSCAEAE